MLLEKKQRYRKVKCLTKFRYNCNEDFTSDDFVPISFKYRPLHCRRYVNDIFVLFKSLDRLKRSQSSLNFCRVNMSFTIKTEVNVISEK